MSEVTTESFPSRHLRDFIAVLNEQGAEIARCTRIFAVAVRQAASDFRSEVEPLGLDHLRNRMLSEEMGLEHLLSQVRRMNEALEEALS